MGVELGSFGPTADDVHVPVVLRTLPDHSFRHPVGIREDLRPLANEAFAFSIARHHSKVANDQLHKVDIVPPQHLEHERQAP